MELDIQKIDFYAKLFQLKLDNTSNAFCIKFKKKKEKEKKEVEIPSSSI